MWGLSCTNGSTLDDEDADADETPKNSSVTRLRVDPSLRMDFVDSNLGRLWFIVMEASLNISDGYVLNASSLSRSLQIHVTRLRYHDFLIKE